MLRHKSTIKYKNGKHKDLTFIEEEYQITKKKFDNKKNAESTAHNLVSNTGSSSIINMKNNYEYNSLSSFLPPVNKPVSSANNESVFSRSANFEDSDLNNASQLSVYKSMNNDKKLSEQHLSRAFRNEMKLGSRSKTLFSFNNK